MLTIRDVMTVDVTTLTESTPITEALRTLIDGKISGAPVINKDRQIVGVVSEVDLLSLFWESDAETVGNVMTADPVCFDADRPLVDVVDCLMGNNFRRVLIHDNERRLVGLVSRADLMPVLLDELLNRRSK